MDPAEQVLTPREPDLIVAVRANLLLECTRLIDSGHDIHERHHNGDSALMVASDLGFIEIVELLLAKGANIHDKRSNEVNSLMLACSANHLAVAKCLLDNGANIHDRSRSKPTALILVAYHGHVEISELLLDHGANIDDRSMKPNGIPGNSAIETAYVCGRSSLVNFYLSKGVIIERGIGLLNYDGAAVDEEVIRQTLTRWPTTMFILVFQELGLIFIIDSQSVIDFHEYVGDFL